MKECPWPPVGIGGSGLAVYLLDSLTEGTGRRRSTISQNVGTAIHSVSGMACRRGQSSSLRSRTLKVGGREYRDTARACGCFGRSDRRAQGDRPTLRSIRPKRARVGLQTLPNRSEKPPGRPTLAPAGSSGPRGGPASSARPRRPRPCRSARGRPASDSRRPSARCGNAGPGITERIGYP
jgi:hypothetical protein